MECLEHSLITWIWTFYHSNCDTAHFDLLSHENPQCLPRTYIHTLFEVTQRPRMYMYITSSDKWNQQKSGHSSCLEQTINSFHWERSLVAWDILISRLLLCFSAWYIWSQHPFGLPLTVNGMFRTQSDYMNLDLLSLELWYGTFWPSVTWKLCKAQHLTQQEHFDLQSLSSVLV